MNDKLGIAVIGAGAVVEHRHLPGMQLTGASEPRCIFDPDASRAQALASQFGIPRVAGSLQEAVSGEDIDAVIVASPNSFHREGVERAVEAGKHVLCEKPIALNLRDARAMCTAAEQAGKVLFLGFHHRFSGEHRCVRKLVEAGVLGEVRAFNSLFSEPIDVVPRGAANYRFQPAQGGGLTLIDPGSHRIDQLRDLLGDVEEVYAEMASVMKTHELDDSVVLTLKMKSGALGSLNFHRFSRAFLSPCTLLGTEATICFSAFIANPYQSAPVSLFYEQSPGNLPEEIRDYHWPEDWWSAGKPGWINLWPPRNNAFREEHAAFTAAIRNQSAPAIGGEDGYKALEIVLAAYLSLRERRPIRLPLDPDTDIKAPHFPTRSA